MGRGRAVGGGGTGKATHDALLPTLSLVVAHMISHFEMNFMSVV